MTRGSFEDYFDALAQRESSDDYGLVSSLGFLGRYQMSEPSLQEIGYYRGDGTAAIDFVGAWTGRNGINSTADFLASQGVQDAAAREYTDWNWQILSQYGFDIYAGQTLNGHRLTVSGILGATWLVGFEGMRAFLESGGQIAADDPYGTSMLEYLALLNDYDVPARYSVSLGGDNVLTGGAGDDRFVGRGGNDRIDGGAGYDGAVYRGDFDEYRIDAAADGSVRIAHSGGSGIDGVDRTTGIDYFVFADRTVARADIEDGDGGRGTAVDGARLVGSGGPDRLIGTAGDDVILAARGDDFVRSGRGDDRTKAGSGDDVVVGAAGRDVIAGGGGDDRLVAGSGDDRVAGGGGGDVVKAGTGSDTVAGGAGADLLVGGAGADEIRGGAGADTLFGGSGDDAMFGGGGADLFVFGPGDGHDWIGDFDPATDVVDLTRHSGLAHLADLLVKTSAEGFAILSPTAADSVTLAGVRPEDLDEGNVLV
ncbi:calcium-binding protein [Acuticoccus mangrovi]|uniref:Calcium-binding protein n=1 Tax=Acuticoccus mangrovi TaxID=2796142 RepID=A0A934MFN2_9HYPH|nr:calcium-binding protein [Acuticoccus mangrovi]MBJ3774071.1 hypothetical protein [Acuticoccus mangrovi]